MNEKDREKKSARGHAFRERFEFKGRYRQYLSAVPTYVVTHPFPAFPGLKTLFGD